MPLSASNDQIFTAQYIPGTQFVFDSTPRTISNLIADQTANNPAAVQAFMAALDEAEASINKDKHAAALAYLRISKDKSSVDEIEKMISAPEVQFTTLPQNTVKYADFMARTGLIKAKPASWKDLFFPTAQSLQGS